jgi:TolA-binding protein
VTRHLSDERLLDILRSGHHPQTVCQMIRQGCYEAGAEDNLTAIVIDFGPRSYAEELPSARSETTVELVRPDGGRVIEVNLRDDGPEDPTELLAVDRRFEGESIEPGEVIETSFEPADEAGEDFSADEAEDLDGNEDGSPEEYSEDESAGEPEDDEEAEGADSSSPPEKPESGGWLAGVRSFLAGMRLSLLLIGVVAGVLIGAILGPPLTERFNDLFGVQTIYDQLRIEQPPRDPEVNASYARYLEGRREEARQRLEQLAAANANNAEAIYYLGVIDYAQGRYPEAIVRFRQAVQLDPTLPNVRVRLAMAYLSTGQLRTGRDTLQEILTPQGPQRLNGEPGNTSGDPMASPTPAGSPVDTEAKPVG